MRGGGKGDLLIILEVLGYNLTQEPNPIIDTGTVLLLNEVVALLLPLWLKLVGGELLTRVSIRCTGCGDPSLLCQRGGRYSCPS